MSKKEMTLSSSTPLKFSEDRLFDRKWHLKLLAVIYGFLFLVYLGLTLFLK